MIEIMTFLNLEKSVYMIFISEVRRRDGQVEGRKGSALTSTKPSSSGTFPERVLAARCRANEG
jgi:hypothetical protein